MTTTISTGFLRKVLLACGILSSLLFVAVDIYASGQWADYSYTGQAYSELTAVEAPTRDLMVFAVSIPYNLLTIAFAAGIWLSSAQKRAMRTIAIMLMIHAVAGFTGSVCFPMHSRGAEKTITFTDTMHIVCTGIEVLSMLLAIGFGAAAFGKRFRAYSIVTILLLIAGGVLASLKANRVAAGLPTPWMGITERVNIYGFMLWIIVLAIVLLRQISENSTSPSLRKKGQE